jgi:hypothetical protein
MDLKDLSRKDINAPDGFTAENIQLSCLMRIADAVEVLTKDWSQMKKDVEYLRARNRVLREALDGQKRRIARAERRDHSH